MMTASRGSIGKDLARGEMALMVLTVELTDTDAIICMDERER